MQTIRIVGPYERRKPYIDTIENVFGGVRISPAGEPQSREYREELGRRPWLTGVTMSEVQVRLTHEDEPEPEE